MATVRDVMTGRPVYCHASDSLNRAAQLMWENNCGSVVVIDFQQRPVGMITDRDVCMGAYTQGRALADISVASVCSQQVQICGPDDSLETAQSLMLTHRVRCLPVTDDLGHVMGLVSSSDLARNLKPLAKPATRSSRAEPLVMEAIAHLQR